MNDTMVLTQEPNGTHSRYIVVFNHQAPTLTNITGLLSLTGSGELDPQYEPRIVALASNGSTERVNLVQQAEGDWVVLGDEDDLFERVVLDGNNIVQRETYIEGFADDLVPGFHAPVTRW